MKGPKPPAVNLSEAEQQGLEKLVKAHSTPNQIVVRARIIFDGQSRPEQRTGRSRTASWRRHGAAVAPALADWQAIPLTELSVEERLHDLPRAGKPSALSADQLCQITALACEKPEQSERADQPLVGPRDCR